MPNTDNSNLVEPPYYELLTERLKLRTLRVSDAEAMMPILTSKEVMQWTTKPPVQSVEQAERWIKDRALGQDVFNFAIELRHPSSSDLSIVGVAGSFHIPKIGYLTHPQYWGKGIASEALNAVAPAIFQRFHSAEEAELKASGTGLDYIEGWIDVDNAASRRVLEKAGFVVCEEMDAPDSAPGSAARVAVLRMARTGRSLEELGLRGVEKREGSEERIVPPVE